MKATKPQTHWKNPWNDAIVVPIEELVECAHGLGEMWDDDKNQFLMTKEVMLQHWRQAGDKLDAYILRGNPGFQHCIGVRYGNEGHQYLSPYGDQEKIQKLLEKYAKRS